MLSVTTTAALLLAWAVTGQGPVAENPASAAPQATPPATGLDARAQAHDGLMLRLFAGVGAGSMRGGRAGEGAGEALGSSAQVSLGGALTDRLSIHADLVLMGQMALRQAVPRGDLRVQAMLGAGVTGWPFGSSNVFLSASVGPAFGVLNRIYDTGPNTFQVASRFTAPGLGVNLLVGKEWWVRPDWGVGVAGQLFYAHTFDNAAGLSGDDFNIVVGTVGVTATYQ